MLKNNLKIILRTLTKQKSFTLIHVIGLTLGLTCCLIIYLFIQYELSFDSHHQHSDNIYRVCKISTNQSGADYSGGTPYPLAPALRTDMPDFADVARIHQSRETILKLENGDKFKAESLIFAEPNLTNIFDFEVLSGDINQALGSPKQAVITQSFANQLFGNKEALGKIIMVEGKTEVAISAIIKDIPENSSFQADMMVAYESFASEFISGFPIDSWNVSVGGVTLVRIPENSTIEQFADQLPTFTKKYMTGNDSETSGLHFQPLSKVHFEPQYEGGLNKSPIQSTYLWIFGSIGLFILIIAIFNFVNLSTVQALKRSKEVGVRKVLGAGKGQLVGQILGEALVITFFSGLLAAVISQLSLPFINEILDKKISESLIDSPMVLGFLFIAAITVGLLSGIYPALSFSNFQPIKVLKSRTSTGNRNSLWLRRGLVIAQFTITMALIIGTIVVSKQLNFLKNKDLGFKQEAIINVFVPEQDNLDRLRTQWMTDPNIENVTFGIGAPTSSSDINTDFYKEGLTGDDAHDVALKTVDFEYFETYSLELLAGRWITKEEENRATSESIEDEDKSYVFVVNETLIKEIGYTNAQEAIGSRLVLGVNDITAEIVGVVKDFNTASLHEEIPPTLIMNLPFLYYDAGIKIKTGNMEKTLAHIEKVWSTQYPNYLFEHKFLDETIAELYKSESQIFYLFQIFAGIAILIACLGLWGLINFVTQQRTKEIGVRKIIGASIPNIIMMLSKDFIFLILIAAIIASPLAWYGMNEWLNNFAFSTTMAWWVFALATIITVLITFLTVGYQSFRAATSNPIESLRTE